MNADGYAELCERIRDHCRRRHWFGPDCAVIRYGPEGPIDYYCREPGPREWYLLSAFRFPPVDEARVRTIERGLGFTLPGVLRAVYTQLADGGVGPGYGLKSLARAAETLTRSDWRISEQTTRNLRRHANEGMWCQSEPDGLLTLSPWSYGFDAFSKVDLWTDYVYFVDCNPGMPPEPNECHDADGFVISFQATSVEA